MKLLVVVLDGLSYVFANTFLWWDERISELWRLAGHNRRLLYVDVLPETYSAANTLFSLPRRIDTHVKRYIWEHFDGLRVAVFNVPVDIPPVYYGVPRPRKWLDYAWPPRERFRKSIDEYHAWVKSLLSWLHPDLAIVWYVVPDQAHHHFFPTIHDEASLRTAIEWYGYACSLAVDLIKTLRPSKWLVLSDHGLSSDVQDTPSPALYHQRDAAALSSHPEPPSRLSEVPYWIFKQITG